MDLVIPILRDASEKNDFTVYVYCFMPDHLHMLANGGGGSELARFMKVFKQQSSYVFRRSEGISLWQRSYYDHVLRSDEVVDDIVLYILNNPVRAGLVSDFWEYEFSGSFAFDIKELIL